MAKIGLVTVLFNGDELLPDFFKSISIQLHKEYVVYLVDNSPTEETDKVISECIQQFPISAHSHFKSEGNIGVASGNNVGIKQAIADGCDYILLLNNDIIITQNFMLTSMVSLIEKNGENIIVPKIFYENGEKLWMAGGYMDMWRGLGVHYGYNKPDGAKYSFAKYVTYSPTCFMMIKKEVFDKVGLMDEKYFAYYDDTDFVLRANRKGYRIYYEPILELFHKVSSSAGTNSPFYVFYSNRNKIYFIRKNLKGIKRYFALSYTILSRIIFYFRFDSIRQKKLIAGLKQGFAISIEKSN